MLSISSGGRIYCQIWLIIWLFTKSVSNFLQIFLAKYQELFKYLICKNFTSKIDGSLLNINVLLDIGTTFCPIGGITPSSSSSSSCRAASTDIPDPLSPLLPIVHRLWQVFRAISRILTELLYVCSSWSSCFCSAICGGPWEYIT